MLRAMRGVPSARVAPRAGLSAASASLAAHTRACAWPPHTRHSHSFSLVESRFLKDFGCEAQWFKHARTGADWVHVSKAADTNNVFVVGFQTAPSNSTGVPHILEHTTLCGSQLYPVRDPFFKMLNRSMATFMNALTGDDLTMYPFSSENKTDYYNLMSVYLDAVFAPHLRRLDFMQEGWRLENETLTDKTSPIVFKGVVYNEMKGALADTNSLFQTRHQQSLYANSTYSHVSGGDPENITDLTHEQLVAFHAQNYHPSNARFFTYGSFPLQEQMERVEAKLASFSPIARPSLEDVPRWTAPRTERAVGPVDPMGDPAKQTRLAVSFMTNLEKDIFESFAMRILADLLTDGAASPMYKALIESGLGSDYSATTGYSPYAHRTSMSFGLQGMESKNVPVAIESIHYVLHEAARAGFPKARIDSIFHQIELELKHRTAGFGMNLGWSTLRNMVHGGNPLDAMDTAQSLERLRTELRQPGFFESRIESYLIANPHRLTYVMEPDASYPDSLVEKETARLAAHVSALTEADREQIFNDGLALQKLQDTKEDLSCLPCLPLANVSREASFFDVVSEPPASRIRKHWRQTQTNGVSYLHFKWDVSSLSEKEKLLLPLLSSVLTSLGTESKSLADLDEAIRAKTGGISATVISSPSVTGSDARDYLVMTASALDANIGPLYSLVREVLLETRWTALDQLKTAVLSMASNTANSVPDAGHQYAMRSAGSLLNASAMSSELFGGMKQVEFLDQISRDLNLESLAADLKALAGRVFSSVAPELLVVADAAAVPAHERVQSTELASLAPSTTAHSAPLSTMPPKFDVQNYPMDLGINYTARAFPGVPYVHQDAAALRLLASLMTTHFMHRELREKGGAYGGGARYGALEGVFYFMSYRDPPRAQRTLDTYDAAVAWALNVSTHVTVAELEQAKLEAFRGMDRPVDAAHEGTTWFQYGLDKETLQSHRDRIFEATLADVERVAKTYLSKPSASCIIGETWPTPV
ncbi:peptidase M16C associated-domain-containing protein [Entophlyctis helioformis]|nr:peptidase M16C associated-domain-containing protein [Entophlyctis helioformis]